MLQLSLLRLSLCLELLRVDMDIGYNDAMTDLFHFYCSMHQAIPDFQ